MIVPSCLMLFQFITTLICIHLYFVETTRTVAKNLGCKNYDNMNANQVDILIPEVIQVLFA